MKKTVIVLLLAITLLLTSCGTTVASTTTTGASVSTLDPTGSTTQLNTTADNGFILATNPDADYVLKVGQENIDFTKYFSVTTAEGYKLVVNESMLDLTQVDTSKEGTFTVTLNVGGKSCTATFEVVAPDHPDDGGNTNPPDDGGNTNPPDDGGNTNPPDDGGNTNPPDDGGNTNPPAPTTYTSVFTDQNLSVGNSQLGYTSSGSKAFGFDDNRGVQFLQRDGTVTITSAKSITDVSKVSVEVTTNCDTGMKISVKVGNTALTSGGQSTVTVKKTDGTTIVTFSAAAALSGKVSITRTPTATSKSMYISSISINGAGSDDGGIGGGGNGGNSGPNQSNMMPSQSYNPSTMDKSDLQDQLMDIEGCIGLPSTGTYSCLVVPVQFAGDSITSADLAKLNKAFNGTSADTGWESVASYYQKTSYGQLNLSFDIQNVYSTTKTASYYNNYSKNIDMGDGYSRTQTGAELLLLEVLAKLEKEMDLTKYDYNDDGVIDGVYLIYSAPVDYEDESSIFWAYVDYYIAGEKDNQTFDGLDVYYYLFAGFDFMDEDADTADGYENMGIIPGLKINAATYIHETGHLLAMDDYYDYYQGEGSDEGLGGADMMDYTVGDHNPYTKLMMGWITPTIVTSTQTIDLSAFVSSGKCILIPLDFNNSYFCEYLLIDFYSATGLNELHAGQDTSYLYDGAAYGVRIYHVVSWIDNPFSDDYFSATNNNNSLSDVALIKLLEADGTNYFSDSDGFAMDDDLWQTGDKLSSVFPGYTRTDGKTLNFDIQIVSTNAGGATIAITFAE